MVQGCENVEKKAEEVRIVSRFAVSIRNNAAVNEVLMLRGVGYGGRGVTDNLVNL